ncbi:MAG: hypothetical protein JRJ02_02780, partial [Deltaproteobacteria bacterium]|nr:hypothetical protein [Deltaproteobacteria bacterium]
MAKKRKQKDQDITIFGLESEGLKTLLDISQSLHKYRHLNDLITYIINRVIEALLAETVSVILYDEGKNEFVFCWSTDMPERREKFDEIRFPAD